MQVDKLSLGLLIARLSVGALLLFHGVFKLSSGIDWIKGMLAGIGLPQFFGYGVYVGEIVAPLLLIIGFRTKIGAAIIAFNMLVAVLMVHSSKIGTLNQAGGWSIELDALFFFGAIALFFTGGGNYAVSKNSKWD